ncbi:MAG: UDP-3-O-acyl-N-acetylglucosamine deacetylase, partial [Dysgonamonadaceae bacterium]|nr:UDP-3-O-acyl-N-acetylglucosamine deacetylase [Dysgonamonadaceae bacterium]
MNTKQHTLKESFSLKGKGLHTGLDIEIKFNPAPTNHGYKIKRIDLEDQPVIDALAENVKGTQRGTVLSKNEVTISTVEHAMAALYAYQVDNCLIEVNAPEFPILDGSAIVYANEIERVGLAEQDAVRDFYVVKHKIEVSDSETGSSITVLPDDSFGINAHITFDSFFLDNQYATLN